MTVEVQATLTRIKTHPGVLGTLIIDPDGTVLDHELQDKIKDNQQDLAAFIPALGAMASDLVRDLDPQNDLQFLRIRSQKYEILVAPRPRFVLVVIQEPDISQH